MGPNYAGTVLTNLSLFLKFLIHTHSYIYKHIPQNTQVWGFRSKRMCYAHSPWKPLKKIKKVNDKNGSSLGWLLWNCVYISQRANFWVALNFLQMFGTVRGIDIIPLDAYPPIWSCLITGLDCSTRLFVHITWPPHHQICWIWLHQRSWCRVPKVLKKATSLANLYPCTFSIKKLVCMAHIHYSCGLITKCISCRWERHNQTRHLMLKVATSKKMNITTV